MATVLVIDDDPDVRKLVERMLRSAGYEVCLAADGEEGIRQYRAHPADLVITDLYMPNQEGLETIVQLRSRALNLPVIAMSGRPEAGTMLTVAKHLGAVFVLQKPFSVEQLLEAVEQAL
ncbi:MAG: response regulator [Limisphaerales bacterium]